MKLCLFLVFVLFDIGYCRHGYPIQNRHQNPPSSIEYTKLKQNITIPIKIHVDDILAKKLAVQYGTKTRKKLKFISNKIIKDVENIFDHKSLDQKIRLVLLDTRFLKNNSKIVAMDENGSKYLKSYCDWQMRKKFDKRYYSVLLTGLDIYINDPNVGRTSTGRGYMGGMCSIRKSCTVLEWHPKNIGYLLAHEIAHSLSVTHDGPPYNLCKNRGYMMASRYDPKRHPKSWSSCSKLSLKRYLGSQKSWCLRAR